VLFLCSGNYYRSRFAEVLFNALAPRRGLAWRAESRGFRLHPANIGPISPHAIAGLRARGIDCPDPTRYPRVAAAGEFDAVELVVAVKEAEHRPLMRRHFPAWVDRVEYWQIHDLDCAGADEALAELDGQVQNLIERLAGGGV